MNERQRMQYLEASGIDMFVPRFILPQALPSRAAPLPLAAKAASNAIAPASFTAEVMSPVAPVDAPQVANNTATEGRSLSALGNLLQQSNVAPVAELTTDTTSSHSSVKIEPAAEPTLDSDAQFSLSIWRVSEELLVVDSRQVGAALPTEALLMNILRACGEGNGHLGAADIVQWPVVDLPNKPKSWAAAREMVAGLLEGKLLAKPVSNMLLLGQESYYAIANDNHVINALKADKPENVYYQKASIDAFAAEALVLPSLAELLHQPNLKKAVWESLLQHGFVRG